MERTMKYDVDFGSLPMPGGFVIDIEGPDELDHEQDRRIMELLPDGGCWTGKELVAALLGAVSEAVMADRTAELEDAIVRALQADVEMRNSSRILIKALGPRCADVPLGAFIKAART
jgi:hypothetical protein